MSQHVGKHPLHTNPALHLCCKAPRQKSRAPLHFLPFSSHQGNPKTMSQPTDGKFRALRSSVTHTINGQGPPDIHRSHLKYTHVRTGKPLPKHLKSLPLQSAFMTSGKVTQIPELLPVELWKQSGRWLCGKEGGNHPAAG